MLAAAIRSEGRLDPVEHASIQDALDNITARFGAEIGAARASDGPACLVSNELLAYGLLGALSFQSMRVSWRRGLDNTDLLRAHLFIHLAILAAVKGEVDIDGRLAEYEDLIREVGADMPDGPPTFAD